MSSARPTRRAFAATLARTAALAALAPLAPAPASPSSHSSAPAPTPPVPATGTPPRRQFPLPAFAKNVRLADVRMRDACVLADIPQVGRHVPVPVLLVHAASPASHRLPHPCAGFAHLTRPLNRAWTHLVPPISHRYKPYPKLPPPARPPARSLHP